MALIWCAISSHGLGHAAQVVPVLNELGRLCPDLQAILRTEVSSQFFKDRLTIPWTLSPARQDIGCIQNGPLHIDVDATWDAHARFHADWEQALRNETEAIKTAAPSLILSDISYLAIEAGAKAGIPTVGLGNLSWDQILEPLATPGHNTQKETLLRIRQAYAKAGLMIRVAPGLPLPAFQRIADVGPIGDPQKPETALLRKAIGAKPDERTALIGFGGIALPTLPFEQLEQMTGYQFTATGHVPSTCRRCHAADAIALPFGTLLASADLIVTKPGYSTIVEAVTLGKPVVYVRRYNFADEQALVDYLHRHGRAVELSQQNFSDGNWQVAVEAALVTPPPLEAPPPPTGAAEAARALLPYFT